MKVFVIKIFVLLGPQRPSLPVSLVQISIIVTSSKQRNAAAADLLFCLLSSRGLLSQAVKTPTPGSTRFP